MERNYFISIYTNQIKKYCDDIFFKRVNEVSKGNPVCIVDNSETSDYLETLRIRYNYPNFSFHHIKISSGTDKAKSFRNIEESVNYIRNIYLQTNIGKFLILESDTIPPINLLERFDATIRTLPKKWGILGAIYYHGYHNMEAKGLHKQNQALSGCTVYKRELIEKYPFRYDENNLGAYPDYWICHDSRNEFEIYNHYDIRCEHLSPNK